MSNSVLETMFHRSLTDMVRGIRGNKKTENKFISKCLQEIKEELRSTNFDLKVMAIQKLTYLHMLGYDVTWAAFNIIEVMSQHKFTAKRIGYLAASQIFHEGTDVIMLTTNQFRKDILGTNLYESSVAINCLANICTPDLARDLAADIVALLNSSKPYLRKKAVLLLYKIVLKFPDALRPSFPRLKDKLEDTDMTVVVSAVNVICELARKHPKHYLPLAPILFKILTSSNNVWMLIKILKLFGALTPLEKRLGKKLLEPLTNILNSTPSMSLLYECIQTCTIGLTAHPNIIRLCVSKLRSFIEDPDQNLKYLGLLALSNLMSTHAKAVTEHRDLILWCLDDEDITIRLRALDLIVGMVSKKNLVEITQKLISKLDVAEGSYRDELVEKIIAICSQNNYMYIADFEWYITILIELTHIPMTRHGKLISAQLMDVLIRVKVIRPFGVRQMSSLLRESRFLTDSRTSLNEVLYAAAWIVGEFSHFAEDHRDIIESLLQPRVVSLPSHIQAIFMHNVLKVLAYVAASASKSVSTWLKARGDIDQSEDNLAQYSTEDLEEIMQTMEKLLPVFTHSIHIEVQERACLAQEFISILGQLSTNSDSFAEFSSLFAEPLNPVAPNAQKKVPRPEGLDLDQQINEPEEEAPEEDYDFTRSDFNWNSPSNEPEEKYTSSSSSKYDHEDASRQKQSREAQQQNNPYYLKGSVSNTKASTFDDFPPPIETLTAEMLKIKDPRSSKSSRSKRHKRHEKVQILTGSEMPDDAVEDEDEKVDSTYDPFANIDLVSDLKPEEALPVAKPYGSTPDPATLKKDRSSRRRREKSDRSERSERSDRERGRRREREGEVPKKPSAPSSSSNREVREKRGEREKREERKDPKGTSSSSSGAAKKSADVDLLALVGGPAKSDSKASSSLMDLLAPTSALPSLSPVSAEPKKDVSRKESSTSSSSSSRSSRTDQKTSSSSSSRDKPRDSSSRSSGRSDKDAKAAAPDSRKKPNEPPTKAAPPVLQELCHDSIISASYELRLNPAETNKVMVCFHLKNQSGVGSDGGMAVVSGLELKVADTLNMKLFQILTNQPLSGVTLGPGQSVPHNVIFQFQSFFVPQRLQGSISYTASVSSSSDSTKKQLSFTLPFPCSSFILPSKITKEQFAQLLDPEGPTAGNLSLSNTRLNLATDGFRVAVEMVSSLLHLELVEKSINAASLYGRSIQNHHIAALVKERSPNQIGVEIKCSNESLGSCLIAELVDHAKKLSAAATASPSAANTSQPLV